MQDNPFSAMVRAIREDNKSQLPVLFRLGTVTSVNPLRIDVAGLIQSGRDLLKNNILNYFEPGDCLLLTPIEDEQRYIIICKVVDA